ncbi:unnamed protein product, partial [Owenia fusiformis]
MGYGDLSRHQSCKQGYRIVMPVSSQQWRMAVGCFNSFAIYPLHEYPKVSTVHPECLLIRLATVFLSLLLFSGGLHFNLDICCLKFIAIAIIFVCQVLYILVKLFTLILVTRSI